jgi:hypothetical protein
MEYTDCRGTADLSPYPVPQTIENRYNFLQTTNNKQPTTNNASAV